MHPNQSSTIIFEEYHVVGFLHHIRQRPRYHLVTLSSNHSEQVWHNGDGSHYSFSVIQYFFSLENKYWSVYYFHVWVMWTYPPWASPEDSQRGFSLYSVCVQSQSVLELLCKENYSKQFIGNAWQCTPWHVKGIHKWLCQGFKIGLMSGIGCVFLLS